MSGNSIKKISIIGAGEMGHGIAEVFAIFGYEVHLTDKYPEALEKAMKSIESSLLKLTDKGKIKKEDIDAILKRIFISSSLKESVMNVDLVIEAVSEIPELKFQLFRELDQYAPKEAILTSNTSNISITDIARSVSDKKRVAGLHFFNPPLKMKLVEVIMGAETGNETVDLLMELVKKIEKTPVKVLKDRPGFIVNRINAPDMFFFGLIIDRGVATAMEVDGFARSQGLPMGPYELMDMVGIDVVYHSMEYYKEKLSSEYGKCQIYKKMFDENHLGKKTGMGFYDWSSGKVVIDTSKVTGNISLMDLFAIEINEAVKIIEEGIATPSDIDTAVMLGLNRPFGPVSVAKSLTNAEVKSKLEELSRKLDTTLFEPAESIKNGRLKEIITGKVIKKEDTTVSKESLGKAEITASETSIGDYKNIKVEKYDYKVARIILNRPKHNTINMDLIDEFNSAIDQLSQDDDINVILITGQGTTFSAGADLSSFFNSSAKFIEFFRKGERAFRRLAEIPKITITVMKGYALGGGLELAMAADLRIGTEEVILGLPEVTLGLIPGWGGTQRAVKLVGMSHALRLVLTGERITGKEAFSIGLINKIVSDKEKIDQDALEYAKNIAATVAPVSAMIAKRLVNKAAEVPMDIGLEMESFGGGVVFSTEDIKEGISAFMQKRKPNYKGR
ncbi:MAG: 3-hydroxyacyl-CoA dehydrogenase/enoyl-CoA hydratase family protein [Candidatus Thermoplasmatota archaeon]|jgi:enoyl-CoA hydratase/3-hydroxyacyl-CoA dehydrogenase|nr:3-hydroxyacyl-CoA dehydrogenase/enoyl-CoA hydratase family protein [Candidatus Thermoplasmatota archaeon]MCL5964111.1 3-hydroxyacyl-CoA dehydrogenase/enoyl-CoA hydratase family protein [Candidatus Thermoplasmatota archaeon]